LPERADKAVSLAAAGVGQHFLHDGIHAAPFRRTPLVPLTDDTLDALGQIHVQSSLEISRAATLVIWAAKRLHPSFPMRDTSENCPHLAADSCVCSAS